MLRGALGRATLLSGPQCADYLGNEVPNSDLPKLEPQVGHWIKEPCRMIWKEGSRQWFSPSLVHSSLPRSQEHLWRNCSEPGSDLG